MLLSPLVTALELRIQCLAPVRAEGRVEIHPLLGHSLSKFIIEVEAV
jgi:hypothetical protein